MYALPTMVRAGSILLLLLLTACSANDDPGAPGEGPPKTEASRDLRVERISSGDAGRGPERPRVVLAPSAAALSEELGAEIPDSGGGTYLIAYPGERPTGGYSVNVAGARVEGDRVIVRFSLEEPPPDAVVTQSLTYPYVLAVVRGLEARGKEFAFVDGDGRELDWRVRRARG